MVVGPRGPRGPTGPTGPGLDATTDFAATFAEGDLTIGTGGTVLYSLDVTTGSQYMVVGNFDIVDTQGATAILGITGPGDFFQSISVAAINEGDAPQHVGFSYAGTATGTTLTFVGLSDTQILETSNVTFSTILFTPSP